MEGNKEEDLGATEALLSAKLSPLLIRYHGRSASHSAVLSEWNHNDLNCGLELTGDC